MLLQNIPMSSVARHCAGVVRACGSVEAVLAESLISPSFGDDRDQVAFDQMGLLLLNTAQFVEDEASGLGARRVPSGMATLAAHVMLGCATYEYALRAVSRLYEATTVRYGLIEDGEEALIVVQGEDPDCPMAPALEELFAVFLFGTSSLFLGRPLPAIAFQTRDREHPNLNARHWAAWAPVRLAETAGIRIPRAVLAARRVGQGSDQIHWDMIQGWLAAAEGQAATLEARFMRLGDLKVDALAAEAGVSPSSLRKDLNRTHGGFRRVRRKLVADAGLTLLHNSSRSVEAIAAELGYADARSFRRFLKSATGKTPEALRAERPPGRPDPAAVRARIKTAAIALGA